MAIVAKISTKSGKLLRAVPLHKGANALKLDADATVAIVDEATGQPVEAELVRSDGQVTVTIPAGAGAVGSVGDALGLAQDGSGGVSGQAPRGGTSGDAVIGGGTGGNGGGGGHGGNGMLLGLLGAAGAVGIGVAVGGGGGNGGNTGGGSTSPADTTPPAAPTGLALTAADDTGASNADRITSQTTALTITGTAEANATVTILEGTAVLGTGTANASGAFSIDVALAAGAHSLTATARDAANNTGPASTALAITVDTAAPSAPAGLALAAADDTGSSSSDRITNQTSGLTITGTAEANSVVTIKDGTTVVGTGTANGSGAFSVDVGLAAGAHSLTAIATDAAGNVGAASAALAITVDTAAPAAPTGLGMTVLSQGYAITGTAEANSTVVLKDGTTTVATVTANGLGQFSYTYVPSVQGAHSITATASDTAGNVSPASSALAFSDGQAIDGYISGALVFRDGSNGFAADGVWNHEAFTDTNANGLRDSGEAFVDADSDGVFDAEYNVVTDSQGNFGGLLGSGKIVMTGLPGAVDISTGLAFDGTYTAPDGSSVVTPLTTLIAALIGPETSAAQAEALVKGALGISSEVNLSTFDPFVAASDPATASLAVDVQKAAVQVANVLAVVGSASTAAGAEDGGAAAMGAAIQAIADQVSGGGTVDLADAGTVSAVVGAVGSSLGGSIGEELQDLQDALGSAVASVNDAVQQASGDSAGDALTAVVTAQIVAQDTLADDVSDGKFSADSYTGTNLTEKIDDASSQVQQVIAAPPAPPSALAAPERPVVDPAVGNRVSGTEASAGVGVTVSFGAVSGLAAGDTVKLYVGDTVVQSHALTAGEVAAGSYAFTLGAGALGADGSKTVSATLLAAGSALESARSFPLVLTLDTVSLTPGFDPVSAGAISGAEAAAGVGGTLTNIEVGSSVVITVSGQSLANPAQAATQSFTVIGKAFTLDPALLAGFADGTLSLSAKQIDANGNESALGTTTVVLDRVTNTPGTLDLAAADDTGASATDNITKQTSGLTVSGTAEAGATVRIMEGSNVLATVTVNGAGQFSTDLALSPGVHSLTAAANDALGNPTATSAALVVTVDTTLPVPPTVQAPEGPIVSVVEAADGTVITGVTEAGSAVSVMFYQNGTALTRAATVTGTSYSVTLSNEDLNLLGEGYVQFKAVTTDVAGNVSASSLTGQFRYEIQPLVDADESIDSVDLLHTFDDGDGDGGFAGVTPLNGGGFAVFWTVNANLDDSTDTIAVQRFGVDGGMIGDPVVMTGLSDNLLANAEYIGTLDFTALNEGGYALAWTLDRPETGRMIQLGSGNGFFTSALIVGQPQSIYVASAPAGVTFSLAGLGTSGSSVVTPLVAVNGTIEITQAILDLYQVDDRLSLLANGVTTGTSFPVFVDVERLRVYDLEVDPQVVHLSGTAVVSGTTTVFNFGSPLGRNDAFQILSSVTPTAVRMTITTEDGIALNTTGLSNVIVSSNGGTTFSLTPTSANLYAVPQQILDQLGDHDAAISISVNGLPAGTVNVDVYQRAPVATPEGVFFQTFDADGAATSDGMLRLDGGASLANGGDESKVNIATRAGGGFVVSWSVDADGDGNGETVAFQNLDASGTVEGTPIVLSGISSALIANSENVETYDVQQLADGGYALAWAYQLDEAVQIRTFSSGGPTFVTTIPMIGRPTEIEATSLSQTGTYQLRGLGSDNVTKVVNVAMVNGVITVDDAVLANFKPGAALSLLVTGVPQGMTQSLVLHTLITNHVNLAATSTSNLNLAVTTGVSVGGPGRTEQFHVAGLSGQPTTATMTVRLAEGPGSVLSFVPITEVSNVTVNTDGAVVIKLPVSATGDYAMPSWLISYLGDQVATSVLTLSGINTGLSTIASFTFTYRELVANPEGVYVQTFGADGNATSEASARLDTSVSDFSRADDAVVRVSPLPGGDYVVSWTVDEDGNGETDGLAVQRFGPDGVKLGDPVILEGLADSIGKAGDHIGFYDLQALENGGYALAWTADLPTYGTGMTSVAAANGTAGFNFSGVPLVIYLTSAATGGQFTLNGLDEAGVPVSVALTREADGRLTYDLNALDAFANPDRLTLRATNLASGAQLSISVNEGQAAHVDFDQPTHTEQLVTLINPGSVGLSGSGSVIGSAGGTSGRIASFHIDEATYASAVHQFQLVIVPEGNPANYDLTGINGAFRNPNGTISIAVTPDANNEIVVPAGLENQMGDGDATIFIVAQNLAANTPFAVTATVYEMADNPVGVFTQTFDHMGNPQSLDMDLFGTPGADLLIGGPGDDTIQGNGGKDFLVGGAGDDLFILDAPAGQTLTLADVITDFAPGTDHLQLSGGLTVSDVHFVQGDPGTNGAAATDALVIANASGDILARLANTTAAAITAASFM